MNPLGSSSDLDSLEMDQIDRIDQIYQDRSSITGGHNKQDLRYRQKLYIYPFLLTIFGPVLFTMVPRSMNFRSEVLCKICVCTDLWSPVILIEYPNLPSLGAVQDLCMHISKS